MMRIYINKDNNVESLRRCIEKWSQKFQDLFNQMNEDNAIYKVRKGGLTSHTLSISIIINADGENRVYHIVIKLTNLSFNIDGGLIKCNVENNYSLFLNKVLELKDNDEFIEYVNEYNNEIAAINEAINNGTDNSYDDESDNDTSSSY